MSHRETLQKYNWEEIFRKIDEVTDELMGIAQNLDEEKILHEVSVLGAKMQILLGRLKGKMEDECNSTPTSRHRKKGEEK